MPDPAYLESANHPSPESVSSEISTANTGTSSNITSPVSASSHKSSEEVLYELLTLPQPLSTGSSRPKKKAINDQVSVITDEDILQELKDKEHAAAEAKKKKEETKVQRERRAKERLGKMKKTKLEKERNRHEK